MPKPQPKKQVTIHQVLAALLDDANIFPPTYMHQFSDLDGVNLEALTVVWPQVSPDRRAALLDDLEELAEADTLVSFNNVARMAMTDPDPRVRRTAIRLLWEDEDPRLAAPLINVMQTDPDNLVRAAAATTLGNFIYQGELEEIPSATLHLVEEALMKVMQSQEETLIRRRALESLGFSSRKEVKRMLRSAYDTGEDDWIISALFGMGRSANNAWEPQVVRMLKESNTEIVGEAVRAAGELELASARGPLLNMLEDETLESDVRAAAIWSLSKIGGEGVRDALETMLDEAEDEEDIELLENALDSLAFTEDMDPFGKFDGDQDNILEDEGDQPDAHDEDSNPGSGGIQPKRPPKTKLN